MRGVGSVGVVGLQPFSDEREVIICHIYRIYGQHSTTFRENDVTNRCQSVCKMCVYMYVRGYEYKMLLVMTKMMLMLITRRKQSEEDA